MRNKIEAMDVTTFFSYLMIYERNFTIWLWFTIAEYFWKQSTCPNCLMFWRIYVIWPYSFVETLERLVVIKKNYNYCI